MKKQIDAQKIIASLVDIDNENFVKLTISIPEYQSDFLKVENISPQKLFSGIVEVMWQNVIDCRESKKKD